MTSSDWLALTAGVAVVCLVIAIVSAQRSRHRGRRNLVIVVDHMPEPLRRGLAKLSTPAPKGLSEETRRSQLEAAAWGANGRRHSIVGHKDLPVFKANGSSKGGAA